VLLVCEWDPLLGFLSVMVRPEADRPVRTRDVVFILAGVYVLSGCRLVW
jgi:hypothetical protein